MNKLSTGLAALSLACLSPASSFAAGALVHGPMKSAYVYMTHRYSPDAAANAAMSHCLGKYGDGCRVLKTYSDGCIAIAQSSDGSHASGWAWRHAIQEANLIAVGECAKNGSACHLDVSVCE